MSYLEDMFSLAGKTVVITGGGGTLGSAMGAGMAKVGANKGRRKHHPLGRA